MQTMVIFITVAGCVGSAGTPDEVDNPRDPPSTASTTTAVGPSAILSTSTTTSALSTETTGAACWSSPINPSDDPVTFQDLTQPLGLVDPLLGMHGHSAAWGDVNGDGWADLYVGTFADRPAENYRVRGASGPSAGRLLWGGPNGFAVDPSFPEERGRAAGAVFADLDSDEEQELVVAHNEGRSETPGTSIFDPRGDGWRRVELPVDLGARAIGVMDADGDGLLDLFVTEDRWSGGSSRLLRNQGELTFADVTERAGLPLDVHGLGVSTVDLNADRWPDIFISGSNRLFVNETGTFREMSSPIFEWEFFGDEDDVAGVAVADLDRDRLPDLVLGQHFNSTLDDDRRVPVRLYLNRSDRRGDPTFEDVTEEAGLVGLPTKAPHVEIVDMNNDGWPDIVTSASTDDGTRPAIFMHQGSRKGVPFFEAPNGLGSEQYWVTGAAADIDHDGRQDLFLVEWEPSRPSLMLLNTTEGGHWLSVGAARPGWGPGTLVDVYQKDSAGDPGALLGSRQIVVGTGYAAGIQPVAHFGLGDQISVDVVVTTPDGDSQVLTNTKADQHIELGSCP